MNRRQMLIAALTSSTLLVAGCATPRREPEIDFVEVVRRLLLLAASRALADLMRDGGFYETVMNRIRLPRGLSGAGVDRNLMGVLLSATFRDQFERVANRAAERGAAIAAPIVADTVRTMPVLDAMALVRGEPAAATGFLRNRLGPELARRMVPEIGQALRLTDVPVVNDYLARLGQVDIAALASDISGKAADVIYASMAREEAAIRTNPQATGDALLMRVFAAGAGGL